MKKEKEKGPGRIQFYLPPDQLSYLDELHRKTLKPRAYFVRQAIREYARKRGTKLSLEDSTK